MGRLNIIDTITRETGLSQIQIADQLHVSKSTISAWRMGAPIPHVKERRLMRLLTMNRRQTSRRTETFDAWKILVKSPKNSKDWQEYMRSLGVNLHGDWRKILIALSDMGVDIPANAPDRIEDKSTKNHKNHKNHDTWEEEEEENSSIKLKPLDILLSKLLTNLNILDEWCEMFLPKTRDGELIHHSRLIKNKLVDIAFFHIDPTLIINVDADPKPFISNNSKIKEKLSKEIESLCEELIENRANLRTDYFEILRVSPDRLIKIISDYEISSMSEPHIEDYLSYGEKRIYEAIQENMRVQKQLIEHMEILRKNDIENIQRNKKNEGLLAKINKMLVHNF